MARSDRCKEPRRNNRHVRKVEKLASESDVEDGYEAFHSKVAKTDLGC
jgi:hypothetical protein